MSTPPRIDSYEWRGGREAMLRFGPEDGPVAVLALPLFEEANRMRAFGVSILRDLAERGIAGVLPELPGQGESTLATKDMTLSALRAGFSAVIEKLFGEGRRAYSICLRSGLVIATEGHGLGRWCLSPLSGRAVLDQVVRLLAASRRDDDVRVLRSIHQFDETYFPIEAAGNLLTHAMAEELGGDRTLPQMGGIGIPTRVVRLESERHEADLFVPGSTLWRRAEPDTDPALSQLLAGDIASWIEACES